MLILWYCGTGHKYDGKKADFKLVPVRIIELQKAVLDICTQRNDEWAQIVKGRIGYVNDLHSSDAVYHQACSVNFRTHKQIPQKYIPSQLRSLKQAK